MYTTRSYDAYGAPLTTVHRSLQDRPPYLSAWPCGQRAMPEALPGASRPTWWLKIPFDAYFKLARVQVKPGSNNNFRGVSVPVPLKPWG